MNIKTQNIMNVLVTVVLLFGLLIWAKSEIIEEENFYNALHEIKVQPPEGIPEVSEKNIALAMTFYAIDDYQFATSNFPNPRLDRTMKDRGLTYRYGWSDKSHVFIGPPAFQSWSLLGSTLGHEIEVHAKQNFLWIVFMDWLGLEGTVEAERQAYLYELANSERFGLNAIDQSLVLETMAYFYPQKSYASTSEKIELSLKRWLARGFYNNSTNPKENSKP